jgi:hypothetical protein
VHLLMCLLTFQEEQEVRVLVDQEDQEVVEVLEVLDQVVEVQVQEAQDLEVLVARETRELRLLTNKLFRIILTGNGGFIIIKMVRQIAN